MLWYEWEYLQYQSKKHESPPTWLSCIVAIRMQDCHSISVFPFVLVKFD